MVKDFIYLADKIFVQAYYWENTPVE